MFVLKQREKVAGASEGEQLATGISSRKQSVRLAHRLGSSG